MDEDRSDRISSTTGDIGMTSKDNDFWMEDGNVILVARGVGFRVYKNLLADRSLVFADMFSLPQPHGQGSGLSQEARSRESGEGWCPIVPMDDAPEDLRLFLHAFMPRKRTK